MKLNCLLISIVMDDITHSRIYAKITFFIGFKHFDDDGMFVSGDFTLQTLVG